MAFLDEVMVEQISADARTVDPARVLLTAVAAVFFALGWVAAKVFGGVWLALVWSALAVRAGWREGGRSTRSAPPAR